MEADENERVRIETAAQIAAELEAHTYNGTDQSRNTRNCNRNRTHAHRNSDELTELTLPNMTADETVDMEISSPLTMMTVTHEIDMHHGT